MSPIIPHESVADIDCPGCLILKEHDGLVDILCNECAAVIRTVAPEQVEAAMAELARADVSCSARCTHCGALNTFPGFAAIDAFICVECGEAVSVEGRVQ